MRAWLTPLAFLILPTLLLAAAVPPKQTAPRLFSPLSRPAVPAVSDPAWANNPIDHFILAKLEAKKLAPTRPADRLTLLRRVTFDLTGLPPTIAEQEAFLNDASPDAYEKVVLRLLDSPRFGERWAQHWLDLVRFAESDGFKEDAIRPDAYRYRDWVIRALNDNLPYDRFVAWQLAGDELAPDNPDALIATGFCRLWPDEYNAANLEQRRQEILDDHTDTVGLVFLGLTVGCARCHDHKYDPTSQKDYYRLQSFFAAMLPTKLTIADPATRTEHARKQQAWEAKTKDVRDEIEKLIGAKREQLRADTLLRFNPDIQKAVKTEPEKRTPLQWQIALTALKQVDRGGEAAPTKLDAAGKKRYEELQKKLTGLGSRPAPLPTAMAITDVGPIAPPTHRLVGGDWRKPAKEVLPGFPTFLAEEDTPAVRSKEASTGRRSALAQWLTNPRNPLTARVIVNRLWQHHFGVGIVATASDFGAQGTPPTHPELLDWLAVELIQSGWDLKRLHRLMVTSATYQQDSVIADEPAHRQALKVDRDNELLWHARRRRLEGEAIRDSVLALSGELSPQAFGVSAKPELPSSFGKAGWTVDADERSRNRRSVYVLAKRNLRYPLFDAFDQPDMHNSCSRRLQTTTAPQALMLLNGELTLSHARRWSQALRQKHGDVKSMLADAYRSAWGRPAESDELQLADRFLARQGEAHRQAGTSPQEADAAALVDFCHALLNTNEFVFVD